MSWFNKKPKTPETQLNNFLKADDLYKFFQTFSKTDMSAPSTPDNEATNKIRNKLNELITNAQKRSNEGKDIRSLNSSIKKLVDDNTPNDPNIRIDSKKYPPNSFGHEIMTIFIQEHEQEKRKNERLLRSLGLGGRRWPGRSHKRRRRKSRRKSKKRRKSRRKSKKRRKSTKKKRRRRRR